MATRDAAALLDRKTLLSLGKMTKFDPTKGPVTLRTFEKGTSFEVFQAMQGETPAGAYRLDWTREGIAMQTIVGWPYMAGAARQLRHGAANMDTLIAVGTLAALGAGLADVAMGMHSMSLLDGGLILTFVISVVGVIIAIVAIVRWIGLTRSEMADLPLEH